MASNSRKVATDPAGRTLVWPTVLVALTPRYHGYNGFPADELTEVGLGAFNHIIIATSKLGQKESNKGKRKL